MSAKNLEKILVVFYMETTKKICEFAKNTNVDIVVMGTHVDWVKFNLKFLVAFQIK
jgi:nucleotide-binding universal stress UspA family protein